MCDDVLKKSVRQIDIGQMRVHRRLLYYRRYETYINKQYNFQFSITIAFFFKIYYYTYSILADHVQFVASKKWKLLKTIFGCNSL